MFFTEASKGFGSVGGIKPKNVAGKRCAKRPSSGFSECFFRPCSCSRRASKTLEGSEMPLRFHPEDPLLRFFVSPIGPRVIKSWRKQRYRLHRGVKYPCFGIYCHHTGQPVFSLDEKHGFTGLKGCHCYVHSRDVLVHEDENLGAVQSL